MAASGAVILAVPVAGQAVARHGSGLLMRIGGLACVAAVTLPVLAPRPVLVALALVALGATSASMDVAMNSHGVHVEEGLGRPIMSSLHAGWSFGGMAGSGFAALATALGVDPRLAVAVEAALLAGLLLVVLRGTGEGAAPRPVAFALPPRGVLVLAILCFLTMVTEGAMGDWGGLYLRRDLGAAPALAASAFALFTGGMTLGRVLGDAVNRRLGRVRLLRAGATLAGAALAVTLLAGLPGVALAGLFLVGLGVANGVPLMFSAAGSRADTPAGPGIAAVSSMGSLGFLAGPPFIGFLGQAVGLPWALATLVLAAAAVVAFAGRAA